MGRRREGRSGTSCVWGAVLVGLLVACSPPEERTAAVWLASQGSSVERSSVERSSVERSSGDSISIDPARELVITDVSVVDDAHYTQWAPDASDMDSRGAWSFGRLMDNMLDERQRTPEGLSRFVLQWLRAWEQDGELNGHRVPARPLIRALVVDPWRTASGCAADDSACQLDFARAPFRLLAIVYRPDLRRVPGAPRQTGYAGQGRFVFGVVGPEGQRLPFTVILEYQLPARHAQDIIDWAWRWNALGRLPFGQEYNARLHEVTRDFTRRGAVPGGRHGSALLQLRTNEVPLSPVLPKLWEMREFVLGPRGWLEPVPVSNEPHDSFNDTAALAEWVDSQADAILEGRHTVPRRYRGAPFQAGVSLVPDGLVWRVPGAPEPLRQAFALGTCGGCHLTETGTRFLHLRNRDPGTPSGMSPWLQQQLLPGGERFEDYLRLLGAPGAHAVQDGRGRD